MPGGSDLPEATIFRKTSGVSGFTGSVFFSSSSAITGMSLPIRIRIGGDIGNWVWMNTAMPNGMAAFELEIEEFREAVRSRSGPVLSKARIAICVSASKMKTGR